MTGVRAAGAVVEGDLTEAAVEGVVFTDRADVSAFSLTMICSPVFSPRLLSGSSGIRVRLRGGYPDFTLSQDARHR